MGRFLEVYFNFYEEYSWPWFSQGNFPSSKRSGYYATKEWYLIMSWWCNAQAWLEFLIIKKLVELYTKRQQINKNDILHMTASFLSTHV